MNNSDTRIIDILRTPNAILAVLAIALVAQIPHAADVFNWAPSVLTGHPACTKVFDCPGSYLHSYLFAFALEAAVLLFVIWHRHWESLGFAVVSILMNLSYYALQGIHLFGWAVLPAWLVSIALPTAIALYSHTVGAIEQKRRTTGTTVRTRTVRDTCMVEQSEVTIVPDDEQPEVVTVPAIEQHDEFVFDASAMTDEQKRMAVLAEVSVGGKINKSELARKYNVRRAKLYEWIES